MKLFPHQQKAIRDVATGWEQTNKVCLQLPTGSGKTFTGLQIVKKFQSSIFIVHRKELLKQTAQAYDRAGIKYGFIAAGFSARPPEDTNHFIAMKETLLRRMDSFDSFQPELIVCDEAHLCMSKGYEKIFKKYLSEPNEYNFWQGLKPSKLLGLTATPERLDGKGLDGAFSTLVTGPSVRELIDGKYLADYDLYGSKTGIDVKGIKIKMGDFDKVALEERACSNAIVGNAVKEYEKLLKGKQAIVFAAGLKHSQAVADAFNAAGYAAMHVDGTTPDEERSEALEKFKRKELLLLCNYGLFIEGVDVPDCSGVILLRPTKSKTVYLQSIGRALRVKADGSRAVIIDHANNWRRHDLPCAAREWTLKGRTKNDDSSIAVKMCHACSRVIKRIAMKCHICGATQKIEKPKEKKLSFVEGELEKITVLKFGDQNFKKLMRESKTLKDYQAIGKRLNYKPGWAFYKWKERYGTKREEHTERNTISV